MVKGWKKGALIPWPILLFAVLPDPVPGPAALVDAAPCFHPLARSVKQIVWRCGRLPRKDIWSDGHSIQFPAKAVAGMTITNWFPPPNILPDGRFSKIKRAYWWLSILLYLGTTISSQETPASDVLNKQNKYWASYGPTCNTFIVRTIVTYWKFPVKNKI